MTQNLIIDPLAPNSGVTLQTLPKANANGHSPEMPTSISGVEGLTLRLTNTSNKKIVGLTVRWITTDLQGRQEILDFRTDSFFLVRTPILQPNGTLLLAPGLMAPANQTIGFTGPGRNTALMARFQNSAKVEVSLDTVIFEDGEVVGPDRSGTIAEIKARKIAAAEVVKLVSDARKAGNPTTILLDEIAQTRHESGDHVALWKARIAQRLLRSRDLEGDLSKLNDLPEPVIRR
jgi:hypothetical protein